MSQEQSSSATVKVPYVLNDPTSVAEKEVLAAGLTYVLTGNPRQHSYVQNQSPAPGHLAARGSKVELYCVVGPTP